MKGSVSIMTKKITALLLAALLVVSVVPVAGADNSLISTHASDYLSGCAITTTAEGNRRIAVDYTVYGTDEMTQLGATKVEIQRYDDYEEDWVFYKNLAGSSTPNDVSHSATVYFYGSVGTEYRAVIHAYAKNSQGSDSRAYDGPGVYCW